MIRILLFSTVTFTVLTENHFFPKFSGLLLFEGTFTHHSSKKKSHEEVTKQ
jgi:hypothetical protein